MTSYHWPVENIARWKLCQVTTLPGSNFSRWQLCQVTILPNDNSAKWQLCQVANLLGDNCLLTICQVTIKFLKVPLWMGHATLYSDNFDNWQGDIFARWLIRLLIVYKNYWKNDRFIFCCFLKTIVMFLEKRWITTNEPFVLNFWKAKNETTIQPFFGKTIVFLIYLINMSFLTYTFFTARNVFECRSTLFFFYREKWPAC